MNSSDKRDYYWTSAALPGIACFYGKSSTGYFFIMGGVSGHVDHPKEFYAKFRRCSTRGYDHLGSFTSIADAKVAVEAEYAKHKEGS